MATCFFVWIHFTQFCWVTEYYGYTAYFTVIGWLTLKGENEIDVAIEINDFLAAEGHWLETGPVGWRIIACLLKMFFIVEEE